ncbi:MAG: hypothetical protein P4K94_02015 [Terracidiphilus sp.]|nr:hypothetical protein [Terracidiphilus sp.]
MEADWEVEVGGDAPVIEAQWPGFVDLQFAPERAWNLPETTGFPALAEALARLNAAASPVWTAKCDVWTHLEADAFDPVELDADPGCAAHALGCYIDLLPRSGQQWALPALAVADCQRICGLLRVVPLRCCRLDLIIRQAFLTLDRMDLGITAYLTSCGPSSAEADRVLQDALATFTDVLCGHSTLQ